MNQNHCWTQIFENGGWNINDIGILEFHLVGWAFNIKLHCIYGSLAMEPRQKEGSKAVIQKPPSSPPHHHSSHQTWNCMQYPVGSHSYSRKQLLSGRVGEYHGDYKEPWDQAFHYSNLENKVHNRRSVLSRYK